MGIMVNLKAKIARLKPVSKAVFTATVKNVHFEARPGEVKLVVSGECTFISARG